MSDADHDENGLIISDPGAMTTITRRRVNPLTMGPDDVDIVDIAHALSRQCRYNGHVTHFLSVARHCVWVAERVGQLGGSRQQQLIGLMHDSAEAYLGDMIRPLKHGELGAPYRLVEERLEGVIAEHFGYPYPFPSIVGDADNWVLMRREIPQGLDGARGTHAGDPESDYTLFMATFVALTRQRGLV